MLMSVNSNLKDVASSCCGVKKQMTRHSLFTSSQSLSSCRAAHDVISDLSLTGHALNVPTIPDENVSNSMSLQHFTQYHSSFSQSSFFRYEITTLLVLILQSTNVLLLSIKFYIYQLAPSIRIIVQCFVSSAGLPSDLADRIINKNILIDIVIS